MWTLGLATLANFAAAASLASDDESDAAFSVFFVATIVFGIAFVLRLGPRSPR